MPCRKKVLSAYTRMERRLSPTMGLLTSVISIISSPTLSSDVRHKATDLLHHLNEAYKTDKTATAESTEKRKGWGIFSRSAPATTASVEPVPETPQPEAIVEETPIATGQILRVHGIYMDRRRRFEIHVNTLGKLELWDADTGAVWSRHKEKEHDVQLQKEQQEAAKAVKTSGKAATADGAATVSETEDEGVAEGHELGRDGSVFSVELDAADVDMARVTESGGLQRRGTVRDRLQALVAKPELSTNTEDSA